MDTLTVKDFAKAKKAVLKEMKLKGDDFYLWPQIMCPAQYYDLLNSPL
jgi:hypothetical protein